MRKLLVLIVLGGSIILGCFIITQISESRKQLPIFPNSLKDENGEKAYIWRQIKELQSIKEYVNISVANYSTEFYITEGTIDDVIAFYNKVLKVQFYEQLIYPEQKASILKWKSTSPKETIILTYAPTNIKGESSLVIERIWWKFRQ